MKKIWTIGHSTRSINEFISLLKIYDIKKVNDVRSYPGSRRYPHFNKENLSDSLSKTEIKYFHIKELGGRRKPKANSKNMIWKNEGFRGYADYMETEEFKDGINILTKISEKGQSVFMCSEAVWWRCHRSMIADYLKLKEWEVIHILAEDKSEEHPYTQPAKIKQGNLFYDDEI